MPRLEYERIDDRITIHRNRQRQYVVTLTPADAERLQFPLSSDLESLFASRLPLPLADAFDPSAMTNGRAAIARVTIECDDLAASALDLESLAALPPAAVRVSRVRPRIAEIDPTYPLRLVETTSAPRLESYLNSWNAGILGLGSMQVGRSSLSGIETFLRGQRWATADVLHIDGLPEELSRAEALRTSSEGKPGSAGWLMRITELWQTRLVVFEDNCISSPLVRSLAATLVDHGGPAVVLVPPDAWTALYENIVHDRPLDWIVAMYNRRGVNRMTLFGGEGREELLRYSNISARLARPEVAKEIGFDLAARRGVSAEVIVRDLVASSEQMAETLAPLEFEFSEGQGMNPLKKGFDDTFGAVTKSIGAGSETIRGFEVDRGGRPSEVRHVNSAFFRRSEGGEMAQLNQSSALRRGEIVQFGVQIGPLDRIVKTVGPTALIEEQFRWEEHDRPGVSLEVAVSGIDFDVHGSPVQHLWLPRRGTSDRRFFAVSPHAETTIPGVARLRFSIFFRNNVVQSYRMAALVGEDIPWDATPTLLGRALDFGPDDVAVVHDLAWLSTIEYANVALSEIQSLPPRGLSIVANESAGEKVFTVKGDELFSVTINDGVPSLVGDLRTTLRELSAKPGAPNTYGYRFTDQDNLGDPAALSPTLFRIANLGWQLYSAIVNDPDDRGRVDDVLGRGEQVLHVADVLLGDIVPWSLLYDREVDPSGSKHTDANGVQRPLARALCQAAWPLSDGTLPVTECGGAACLLSKEAKEERARQPAGAPDLTEETVICPLHFWGYKHQIEVPVQQTKKRSDTDGKTQPPTTRKRPLEIAAAINRNLALYKEHEDRLTVLVNDPTSASFFDAIADDRDLVKDMLKNNQPDVIYLYCHAFPRKKMKDETVSGPNLGFGIETDETALLAAANITGPRWQRAPLVFLNGCSTVGFNPYAPSPFVVQFVKTRGAAAVIGTEVTVWEILAAEMAETFFRLFLRGSSAGEALRTARRLLLRKNNPLGLVYTLYGRAELQFL
jgi:CHAT domain